MDTEYAEGVELDAAVPLEQCLELEKKLTDLSLIHIFFLEH